MATLIEPDNSDIVGRDSGQQDFRWILVEKINVNKKLSDEDILDEISQLLSKYDFKPSAEYCDTMYKIKETRLDTIHAQIKNQGLLNNHDFHLKLLKRFGLLATGDSFGLVPFEENTTEKVIVEKINGKFDLLISYVNCFESEGYLKKIVFDSDKRSQLIPNGLLISVRNVKTNETLSFKKLQETGSAEFTKFCEEAEKLELEIMYDGKIIKSAQEAIIEAQIKIFKKNYKYSEV